MPPLYRKRARLEGDRVRATGSERFGAGKLGSCPRESTMVR